MKHRLFMLTQEIKVNEVRKKKEPRGGNEENYYGKSIASGDNYLVVKV